MKQTQKEPIGGGRIEYIDALRGFIMILVVCGHVELFMIGAPDYSLNSILGLIDLPLFFFISGFVSYKNEEYALRKVLSQLKDKFFLFVLSPLLFMSLYCYVKDIDFIQSLCLPHKSGYWFTFVLFEFFIIYFILEKIMVSIRLKGYLKDILLITISLFIYIVSVIGHQSLNAKISGLFAIEKFPYFFYFILGAIIRKNWNKFERVFDNKYVIGVIIVLFGGLNIFDEFVLGLPVLGGSIWMLGMALLGVIISMAFFRKYSDRLSKNTIIGRTMQYIGRHTLDIYLIHYFFLESFIESGIIDFSHINLCFFHFVICVIISLMIIIGSLIVSDIIRVSPILGKYLFGAKE